MRGSAVVATSTLATLSEFPERDAGLVLGLGGGVEVPLTTSLALRPEFRFYSSSAMSRVNLDVLRAALAVRYRW